MDPLDHPPEVEDGNDQAAKPKGKHDAPKVAVVDLEPARELPDDDDFEGDGDGDGDEPDA